ncbi:hypothetical protein KRZ98_16595 [Sphingobium sp. AS12]|uniref:hypothetical protein n=1 Tax=Sphingobium sp. AS12 TaxID=2849495 RepID=UPI001C318624|nr:hypothetical protein [Sphingobium sp. AS12]MBV2149865.1 hypothetical protein [Sphingobium sp. AS12]
MRMIIAALAGLGIIAAAGTASAQVNARQHQQRDRIVQGWRSGELTGREAARLGRQQYRIGRTEARMRADGGGLGPRERARLHARQDRASASIYGRNHNRRDRW